MSSNSSRDLRVQGFKLVMCSESSMVQLVKGFKLLKGLNKLRLSNDLRAEMV